MDDFNNNNQPQDPNQPQQNPYEQPQNPYEQQPYQNQNQIPQDPSQRGYYQQPMQYQQPQQYNYYQQPVEQPSKGLSIASMVLGILATVSSCAFYCSIPLGIVGLILGIVSIKKQKPGKGMSIAGIICSSAGIVIGIITIIFIVVGMTSDSPFWMQFRDIYSSAYDQYN